MTRNVKKIRTSIYIPEDLYKWALKRSEKERSSYSETLARVLAKAMDEERVKK